MGGNNSCGWNIPLQGVTAFSLGVPDLGYFDALGEAGNAEAAMVLL